MRRHHAALLFATMAACTTSEKPAPAGDTVVAATPAVDSVSAPVPVTTPPGAAVDSAANDWVVTPAGIGPVRAGMTLKEANAALANSIPIPAKLEECDYVRSTNAPKGVAFMVEGGKIARVDIQDNTRVKTISGAGIGDTEDRIKSLYPGLVMQPHKYEDGHYLVVTPSGTSEKDLRIIFETNGKTVTRFRSGRIPAVEYVEGCS